MTQELSIRMGQPGVHEMLVLKSDFENAVCDFLVLSWFNDLSISHMLAAEIELLAQKVRKAMQWVGYLICLFGTINMLISHLLPYYHCYFIL